MWPQWGPPMTGKDSRLYGRFTLDFPDSPKVAPLSDAAFRGLVEMTLYSRRMLTDGFIAERLALARWGLDVCQELLRNDPVRPSLLEVENGYQIHDFAEHQSTKAEIQHLTEVRKAAGQRGGLAKAKQKPKQKASKTYPETETETYNSLPTDVGRESAQRGARLPDGWVPPTDVVAQMRSEHPHVDVKAEHAKFCDYWRAQPGAKGRKADWVATWRNWIRRTAEQQPTRNGHTPPAARKVGVGLDLAARLGNTTPALSALEA